MICVVLFRRDINSMWDNVTVFVEKFAQHMHDIKKFKCVKSWPALTHYRKFQNEISEYFYLQMLDEIPDVQNINYNALKYFYLLCKHNDYPLRMMLEFSSYFHYDKEYSIIKFVKIMSFLGYQQRCIELMYEFLSKVKQNQLSIVYL